MGSGTITSGGEGRRNEGSRAVTEDRSSDVIDRIVAAKTKFFQSAADRTTDPVGKKMFLSMMEDEKEYGESLRRVAEGLGMGFTDISYLAGKVKAFLERNGKALLRKIRVTTDEIEAVRIAMELERESIGLCERLSRRVRNPKKKAFLEEFAKEEQQLYTVFSNTGSFLSDPRDWFMSNEHAIMDGGTPWA